MADDIYVFDTNSISALVRVRDSALVQRIYREQPDGLILPEPTLYEVERGLLYKGSSAQLTHFRDIVVPQFQLIAIQLADWRAAATLWALTRGPGRQLSDIDLLLAAMTVRLDGVLVTDDRDFDYLPMVHTENWLQS